MAIDYASRRVRRGKTQKDKRTGAWNARFANQAARAEWQKNNRATNDTFPGSTRSKK